MSGVGESALCGGADRDGHSPAPRVGVSPTVTAVQLDQRTLDLIVTQVAAQMKESAEPLGSGKDIREAGVGPAAVMAQRTPSGRAQGGVVVREDGPSRVASREAPGKGRERSTRGHSLGREARDK